ncbi:MAG: hypothetical protein JSW28_07185 [Thermoplasmata archaeon]|nr:MAG: hypothetical protein JSW28_07185 [Thermoplasmata archaeon]
MVDSGLFCLSMIAFLVLVLVVSMWITNRPKKVCKLPNIDLDLFIPQTVQIMHRYGWKTKVYPEKRKIYVIKNELIAANIYLKPRTDGNIDVCYSVSSTYFGWLLTILFVTHSLPFRRHRDSEIFATREVIPMILYYASNKERSG